MFRLIELQFMISFKTFVLQVPSFLYLQFLLNNANHRTNIIYYYIAS